MFDANRTFIHSFDSFDQEAWRDDHALRLEYVPGLNIRLTDRVYLKTTTVISVDSIPQSSSFIYFDKILFGIEIRF